MPDEDDMFSRWSRRKRAVAEEDARVVPPESVPAPEEEEVAEEDESAVLERLNLPVPETMKAGDDFSVFMNAGVPEFLRKRALRVLWRSNPVLANLDGLNDYDDDFNSPELTKKVLATAYKVGRGIFWEKPEEPEDAATIDDEDAAESEVTSMPVDQETKGTEEVDAVEVKQDLQVGSTPEDDDHVIRPRKMRFET